MESAPVFGPEEIDAFSTLSCDTLLQLAKAQGIDTQRLGTNGKEPDVEQLLAALKDLRGRPGPGQSHRPTYIAFYVPEKPQQSPMPAPPEAGPSSLRPAPSRPVTRSSTRQPPRPPAPSSPRTRTRTRTQGAAHPPASSAISTGRRVVPLGALREDSIRSWSTVDGATHCDGAPTPAAESCTKSPRRSQRLKLAREVSRAMASPSIPPIRERPEMVEESAARPPSRPSRQPKASGAASTDTKEQARGIEADGGKRTMDEKRVARLKRVRDEMLQPDLEFLVSLVQLGLSKCYRRYQDKCLQFKVPKHELIALHLRNIWVDGAPDQIKRDLQALELRQPPIPSPRPPAAHTPPFPSSSVAQAISRGDVRTDAPRASSTGAHENGGDEAATSEAGSDGSARKRRRESDGDVGDTTSTGSAEKRRRSTRTAVPKVDKGKGRAYD